MTYLDRFRMKVLIISNFRSLHKGIQVESGIGFQLRFLKTT